MKTSTDFCRMLVNGQTRTVVNQTQKGMDEIIYFVLKNGPELPKLNHKKTKEFCLLKIYLGCFLGVIARRPTVFYSGGIVLRQKKFYYNRSELSDQY